MAKIQRKTQKIFASNTTADQITAFGTAKNASPTYTTDLSAIQTNVYTQGWTPSLLSDLAPYLQDSNALWFLVTSQLAYLFQQGISEWDSATEYTQGSLVSKYNNGNLEIYMSLQNLNTNHALTSTSWWKKYTFENIQSTTTAVTHTANTAVGSATVPVYVNSSGVATAITSYSGNSATATKATQDGSGNTITSYYEPKANVTSKGNTTTPIYFDASGVATAITSYSGNSATATNATNDSNGNNIVDTYATKSEIASIKNFTVPTYSSSSVSVTFPKSNAKYTAPKSGIYCCSFGLNEVFNLDLYINNATSGVRYSDMQSSGGLQHQSFCIPLNKGDVIYWNTTTTPTDYIGKFHPYKSVEV